MNFMDSLFVSGMGKWLAVAVGLLWLTVIILLLIHFARRRSGYYVAHPLVSKGAKTILLILDIMLFILAVLVGVVAVKFFSHGSLVWEIRLGLISGVIALLGILIVIREGFSLRISASSDNTSNSGVSTKTTKKSKNKT